MKLTFFISRKRGSATLAASVKVRAKGGFVLNTAALATTKAEPGESAAVCFDEDSQRFLLAHWPDGATGQPLLQPLSGNGKGLRFHAIAAASAVFAALGNPDVASVCCPLDPEPMNCEDEPNATFYALTLPATTNDTPTEPGVKQAGVGRGRYDRSLAKKGGYRG